MYQPDCKRNVYEVGIRTCDNDAICMFDVYANSHTEVQDFVSSLKLHVLYGTAREQNTQDAEPLDSDAKCWIDELSANRSGE